MIIIKIILIIILLIILKSIFEIRQFKVTNYYIKSDKIKENQKFVVITDLHNRIFKNNYNEIFGAIDKIAPNKIFIVGDMINKKDFDESENTKLFLKILSEKFQIIYVNGNHEQHLRDLSGKDKSYLDYIDFLNENNIICLKDNKIPIDNNICLYGLEIGLEYYKRYNLPKLKENYIYSKLGTPDRSKYNILLVHTPSYFKEYKEWGADLSVSGHNHGGVIRLPLLGGVISPQCILFPKYFSGNFKDENSELLVSRGIGSHSVNIRVFNKPEIMAVHIKNII